MKKLFVFAAITMVIIGILVTTTAANAVPLSAAKTAGLTYVQVSLDTTNPLEYVYSWKLYNLTGAPYTLAGDWQVLVWSLQPFNVPEPTSWVAPLGWTWDGNNKTWTYFEVQDPDKKWYTPPSAAPGGMQSFTYKFDPTAPNINVEPALNGDLGFICHVGATRWESGSRTGEFPWIPTEVQPYGSTWYDIPDGGFGPPPSVPEPNSILALACGMVGLAGFVGGRRRD